MAETTKIQWCDHTASPWHGCSKTDNPGCDNCYAAAMAPRNPGILGVWGDNGVRVKSKSFADKMQQWQRKAEKTGQDVTVFPSLCDPFEDRPELAPWRQEMFGLADECPNVTLLLLTKRPENIRRMWVERDDLLECSACLWRGSEAESQQVDFEDEPTGWECPQCQSPCGHKPIDEPTFRPNVWLLTSVSDQATADRNIPELLKCRDLSPVLGVSYEPALGPVDFSKWLMPITPFSTDDAPETWDVMQWPEWVPARWRTNIAEFWSQSSFRSPKRWARDCKHQASPPFGCRVFTDTAIGRPGQSVSGRWVHTWNNMGIIVTDDGEAVVASTPRGGLFDSGPAASHWQLLKWLIVGGESGPNARPFHATWGRSAIQQCKDAGVPCFFKQFGSNAHDYDIETESVRMIPFSDTKGGDPSEWNDEFRVREFPTT